MGWGRGEWSALCSGYYTSGKKKLSVHIGEEAMRRSGRNVYVDNSNLCLLLNAIVTQLKNCQFGFNAAIELGT